MTGKFAALVIAAMITGLAAINVALYNTPIDIEPIVSARGDGGLAPGSAGSIQIPEAGDSTETFQRPLFSPTRRKFVPEPAAPPPTEVASVPVEQRPASSRQSVAPSVAPSLLGISIHGGSAKALLQIAGGDAALWYGNGETIDGWTVSAIDKDEAVLERDGRVVHIALYPSDGASSAAGSTGQ